MEILGTVSKKPTIKNGKPDYVHIEYDTLEEYCEATTKLMGILYQRESDGKCIVKDAKGNKYSLEVIHANFNTEENRITVYPHRFSEQVEIENKSKNQKTKKQQK